MNNKKLQVNVQPRTLSYSLHQRELVQICVSVEGVDFSQVE